ncbi:MAG: hypothetical protein EOO77_14920 [Oxalobacteraceae bacterium]|nr:MAG: hypothetical protein EOO77_14920 [Oxalobacteraceae bacterium]
MPRFFFDTHSDQDSVNDLEGVELASPEIARQQLIRALPEILLEEMPIDADQREVTADIRDRAGRIIFTANFSFIGKWLS